MKLNSPLSKNIISIFIIFWIGILFLYPVAQYMDILFADEAQYLQYGIGLPHVIVKWWGPLYAAWYKWLSLFQTDKIALYYLNYKILMIAGGIAMFLLLRSLSCTTIVALIAALLFMQSSVWIETWPRINHFCIILLFSSVAVIRSLKNETNRFACYALVLFILSYARPEFYLTFWMFIVCFILIKGWNKEWNFFLHRSVFITASIILFIYFAAFSPNFSYKGEDRLYMAFRQHFIYNYAQIYKVKASSLWVAKDAIYKSYFGNCKQFSCIVLEHPLYFIKHVLLNTLLYVKLIAFYFIEMLSPKILHFRKWHLLVSAMVCCVSLFAFIKYRNKIYKIGKRSFSADWMTLLWTGLIGITFSVSSLLIFPRQHYSLFLLSIIFIVFSLLISALTNTIPARIQIIVLLVCGVFFVTNRIRNYHFQHEYSKVTVTPNKNMLMYIHQKLSSNYSVFFSVYDAVLAFLPPNFTNELSTENHPSITSIKEFIASNKIDVIYVSPIMLKNSVFLSSPSVQQEWNQFVKNPEIFGFNKINMDNSDAYLLIKQTYEHH